MEHSTNMIRSVVLVGLSGTGKSTLARLVASELGWTAWDTDEEVERRAGATIPELFRDLGEGAFRAYERDVLLDALTHEHVVVATGGGAVVADDVWNPELLGDSATLVVWLDGDSATLLDRLSRQASTAGEKASRPLLEGEPLKKLETMRAARGVAYGRADITLPIDRDGPETAAADIAELVRMLRGAPSLVYVTTDRSVSAISVGAAAITSLPELIRSEWPRAQRVWLGVDEHVLSHVNDGLAEIAARSDAVLSVLSIPSGESSKSLDGLSSLYDWMLRGGVERGDVAVAVGGGVVGDLVGFAASSVLRGVGLIQVPTTLLAMVDSSVGGKTGINHPAGKNLIGAFYQPRHVLVDPAMLETLPDREYKCGWAEIIKHALIEPSVPTGESGNLLPLLERNSARLAGRSSLLLPLVIRKNVSLKAAVVSADEREAGLRAILNFGHTIGHAIEASAYELRHGEAVALGMCAAMTMAHELRLVQPPSVERVRELIAAFGLPVTATFDPAAVRGKMLSDKKKSAGVQQWVLPVEMGGVILRTDVPGALIDRAIESVRRPLQPG